LKLYIDGIFYDSITGLNGWDYKGPYVLSAGPHTVEWRYEKDSTDTGEVFGDTGYVDLLYISDAPTETPTETQQDTSTATATYTHTSTITNTQTYTETYTETLTSTFTFTVTNSATVTNTFTTTDTFTTTNTFTDTFTVTKTNTPTDTFTITSTSTPTSTNTPKVWSSPTVVYNATGNWPCIIDNNHGFTDSSYYPRIDGNYSSTYVAGELGKKWIATQGGIYAAIANYKAAALDYGEAILLKWNGSDWDKLGSVSGSGIYGSQCSLFEDPYNGDLFYAYIATTGDQKVHVKKYSGGNFTDLNHHTVSNKAAYNSAPGWVAITGYNTGYGAQIFIAYVDLSMNSKTSVAYYDGYDWYTFGGGTPNTAPASYIDMMAHSSGNVYITYTEGGKTYVKRSNGSGWQSLGGVNPVSDANGSYNSIYVVSTTEIYVAYSDSGNSYKATIKKFDGTSWSLVGSAGFTPSGIDYNGLYSDGINLKLFYRNTSDYKLYEVIY